MRTVLGYGPARTMLAHLTDQANLFPPPRVDPSTGAIVGGNDGLRFEPFALMHPNDAARYSAYADAENKR